MKLNIIGAGRVGMTLAKLYAQSHFFTIGCVYNRTDDKAEHAVRFIGAGEAVSNFRHLKPADVYMITTTDDALVEVVDHLASVHAFPSHSTVFHCSGSLPSTVLQPLRKYGGTLASVHPVKNFADPAIAVTDFKGTFCGLEGDVAALKLLEQSIAVLGGQTFRISAEKKALYHAATAMACNHLVGLIEAVLSMCVEAGLDRALALNMMQPIIGGTVTNVLKLDTTAALTGPIARGDTQTVKCHLDAMKVFDDTLAKTYAMLGYWVLGLAKSQGSATTEQLAQINNWFDELLLDVAKTEQ